MPGDVLDPLGTRRSEARTKKTATIASKTECWGVNGGRRGEFTWNWLIDDLASLGSRSFPRYCYGGLLRLPSPRDYQLWLPGTGFDGGGALTVGVKRFPPPGLIDFSVGETEVVVVGVVVDVS